MRRGKHKIDVQMDIAKILKDISHLKITSGHDHDHHKRQVNLDESSEEG